MLEWPKSMSRVAASVLSALLTVATPPAHAGDWIADAKSGCRVWNPNPQLEESVAWSGPCVQDRAEGRGIVQWSKGDVPYETDEGEWHEGRQVNEGTQSWTTGRYEGQLKDGEPNGHGILTVQKLRYEGDFRNGRPNGIGRLTAGNETVRGAWKDGCLQAARKASIGVPLSACR
jgi:hypothetical protein